MAKQAYKNNEMNGFYDAIYDGVIRDFYSRDYLRFIMDINNVTTGLMDMLRKPTAEFIEGHRQLALLAGLIPIYLKDIENYCDELAELHDDFNRWLSTYDCDVYNALNSLCTSCNCTQCNNCPLYKGVTFLSEYLSRGGKFTA